MLVLLIDGKRRARFTWRRSPSGPGLFTFRAVAKTESFVLSQGNIGGPDGGVQLPEPSTTKDFKKSARDLGQHHPPIGLVASSR